MRCSEDKQNGARWLGSGYTSLHMGREIQLDGAEISVIKAVGIGAGDMEGSVLLERCADLDFAELSDTVKGLMSVGYLDGDSDAFHNQEEFEKVHFRVNPGYAKDLKEVLDPQPTKKESKRVRRE
jgi:hypothetical protein